MLRKRRSWQAYAYGKFLGELNGHLDDEANIKEAIRAMPILIDAGVAEDETTGARLSRRVGQKPLEEAAQQSRRRNHRLRFEGGPVGF